MFCQKSRVKSYALVQIRRSLRNITVNQPNIRFSFWVTYFIILDKIKLLTCSSTQTATNQERS